jgi:hypothetical protein
MKKLSLILISGLFVMASCNNGGNMDMASMQSKIDSAARASAQSEIDMMMKQCDESIMAMAVDSAKVLMDMSKKGKPVKHSTPTVKHTAPVVPPKPTTVSNNNKVNVGQTSTSNPNKIDVGQKSNTNVNSKKIDVGQKK